MSKIQKHFEPLAKGTKFFIEGTSIKGVIDYYDEVNETYSMENSVVMKFHRDNVTESLEDWEKEFNELYHRAIDEDAYKDDSFTMRDDMKDFIKKLLVDNK